MFIVAIFKMFFAWLGLRQEQTIDRVIAEREE